jgi:hypothetical protein
MCDDFARGDFTRDDDAGEQLFRDERGVSVAVERNGAANTTHSVEGGALRSVRDWHRNCSKPSCVALPPAKQVVVAARPYRLDAPTLRTVRRHHWK